MKFQLERPRVRCHVAINKLAFLLLLLSAMVQHVWDEIDCPLLHCKQIKQISLEPYAKVEIWFLSRHRCLPEA